MLTEPFGGRLQFGCLTLTRCGGENLEQTARQQQGAADTKSNLEHIVKPSDHSCGTFFNHVGYYSFVVWQESRLW